MPQFKRVRSRQEAAQIIQALRQRGLFVRATRHIARVQVVDLHRQQTRVILRAQYIEDGGDFHQAITQGHAGPESEGARVAALGGDVFDMGGARPGREFLGDFQRVLPCDRASAQRGCAAHRRRCA